MRRLLALALLALAVFGAAKDDSAPVQISGDRFVVDEKNHVATFTGNVLVTKTGLQVWAPEVVITYGSGGPSSIKTFTASGGVRIKTGDEDATGDKAVYDPNSKLLHLTGNVIVVNSSGTVGSPELVVNLETNQSTFSSSGTGRVTGVFTPKSK
jgi:lipopolysaccharide export system protein LptA